MSLKRINDPSTCWRSMRARLSTLLLLCIGTGRATWIDSVAVIDAVSEPEPSRDGEVHGEVTEAEDSRLGWTEWSTQAANPNPEPEPSRGPEVASTDAEDSRLAWADWSTQEVTLTLPLNPSAKPAPNPNP